MKADDHPVLRGFIHQYQSRLPQLAGMDRQLDCDVRPKTGDSAVELYDRVYPLIEQILWEADDFDDTLKIYQALFREQESLLNQSAGDDRYSFILSIPIADRPEHLKACLESIYQLCLLYNYGGKKEGLFCKVSVVIAEDSKQQPLIDRDIALAEEYTAKGLKVIHFGQGEQLEMLNSLPHDIRQRVSSIIGDDSAEHFYHKGQAIMRNLSYLKMLQITAHKNNTLYYLVDSDQRFQVNLVSPDGDRNVYALNYFYYINRIFSETKTRLLTGKLVGDPPVSPSVMAGNFLQDAIAFMQQLSSQDAYESCTFHAESKVKPGDAAYHDMANLFGFDNRGQTCQYYCEIRQEHDHLACLNEFSSRLNRFFFGEHPTRKTYFSYDAPFTDITPARTIYPGNYIASFEGLKYIIPFGKLRLRMSGPTAGRLIQAEINERFASVNLPMLHTRVQQEDFSAEFRPGVENSVEVIDLNDEFERQFFGDLMLFSVVELSKQGIHRDHYQRQHLEETVDRVESEMLVMYANKHELIKHHCASLLALLNDPKQWWNQTERAAIAVNQVRQFIDNILHNFGDPSKAYRQIQSEAHRINRKQQMIEALLNYHQDREAWDEMLGNMR